MPKVLVLRSCLPDMTSYTGFNDFVWPESGPTEASDWEPTNEEGHGLHGFLWGEGNFAAAIHEEGAKWLVVEVEESSIVNLGGSVKFPRGNVVFCGELQGAAEFIQSNGGQGKLTHGAKVTTGSFGVAATGCKGVSKSLYYGCSVSGWIGSAESGNGGYSISGYGGKSTSGKYGFAMTDDPGTATTGDKGISLLRIGGIVAAGEGGVLIACWDGPTGPRVTIAYVGEDGIKPNTLYRFNKETKSFEEVIENGQEES